jgi:rare lipoprotein A
VKIRFKDLLFSTLLGALLVLQGCGGSGGGASTGGGYGYGDGPPPRDIDVSGLPDAVPKHEPVTLAGNKSPYTVLGKTYQVMPSSKGFRQRGLASWYGNKFHGRHTSNGEVYSMYEMTAAHKTLPIPCYVKVTNLENGRSVIVRVNDRGPFHGDRIIDLSYAAAKKLGYSDQGTAKVEVSVIDPSDYQNNTVTSPQMASAPAMLPRAEAEAVGQAGNAYLQVGAFSNQLAASDLSQRLAGVTEYPVVVRQQSSPQPLFKVLVGPVTDHLKLFDLKTMLGQMDNVSPFVVYD